MKTKINNQNKTMKILKIEEMSWKQIDKLDRNKTIFFLPISPLEEHGPHLPVGTDLLTSQDAATEAIRVLNKKKPELIFILMPSVPIGSCKFVSDFPGSISVSSKVVKEIIYSTAESLAKHGFKYMVICSFHMATAHLKGIYSAIKKIESRYDMRIAEPWGPYFYNNEVEKHEPKLGFDTKKEVHGGFRETSLMKYQYPYLVDESHKKLQSIYRDIKSARTFGKTFKQLGLNEGYIGSPARADADYGRWFFGETVNTCVNSAIALYEGKPLPSLPTNIKILMKSLF